MHEAIERSLQLANEKQGLEQHQQAQQQAQAQLETRYAASQQQMEDLKTDNARLYQLANQVQANLEHYQQAMQSLRAEQSLEIEKRETNFQHELQALKQALSLAQQQSAALKEENKNHAHANQQYQANTGDLRKRVELLTQEHQQASKEVIRLTEQCLHVKNGLQTQQQEARHYQIQAKELEKQVIILSEQEQQLSTSLRQAKDKIETLRHDKLFLVQEKSELIGALKQMEKAPV